MEFAICIFDLLMCLFEQIKYENLLNVNRLQCAPYWADHRYILGALFSEMDSESEAGDPFTYKPLKLKRKRSTPRRREVTKKVRRKTGGGVKEEVAEGIVQLFEGQPKTVMIKETLSGNAHSSFNFINMSYGSVSMVPTSPQVAEQ